MRLLASSRLSALTTEFPVTVSPADTADRDVHSLSSSFTNTHSGTPLCVRRGARHTQDSRRGLYPSNTLLISPKLLLRVEMNSNINLLSSLLSASVPTTKI